MAEHVTEFTTADGMDYAEHERTYALVMKLARVATAHLVVILIALAIGGVKGDWILAGFGVVLAVASGVVGAASSEKGSLVPALVSGVVLLALYFLFG